MTRKKASVDLVLNMLCPTMPEKLAARLAFDPRSPLLKYRLLQMTDASPDGPSPLISRFLKLDDRTVNFLLDLNEMDARLEPFARLASQLVDLGEVPADGHDSKPYPQLYRVASRTGEVPARTDRLPLRRTVTGLGSTCWRKPFAGSVKLPLLVTEADKLTAGPMPFEEALWLLGREAVLQPAALSIQNFDALLGDDKQPLLRSLLEVTRTFALTLFLLGRRTWKPLGLLNDVAFFDFEIPVRMKALGSACGKAILMDGSRTPRTQGPAHSPASSGSRQARFKMPWPRPAISPVRARRRLAPSPSKNSRLHAARSPNPELDKLARRIRPIHTWDDIVLPADPLAQLGEMCRRVAQSYRVLGEWGFGGKLSIGKGVNALFAGPSGTGKTMAAAILANELGLDLYKIDLSQVVSKYIGETEKNLDAIFKGAENSNAILFFDEADALFGKRSEVRDSHDRYANIEISYLLQKMEDYEGVAILATNLRQNMDEAFVRRLAFSIDFPFPDEVDRRRIWDGIWPEGISLAEDVDLDLLSRQFKLSGGNIKNVALAAAFLASDDGIVKMPHLLHATRREFQKLGQVFTEFDPGKTSSQPPA